MNPTDPYVTQRCAEIDSVLGDAAGWASQDAKLGAHLAAYVSVLISGVVEDCVEHLVRTRAGRAGDARVQELVGKLLDQRFRNPRSDQIEQLLGWFSPRYRDEYRTRVPIEAREALGSIVTNRLSLAHTGTAKQQLTLGDVDGYFKRIQGLLRSVEDVLALS